MDKKLVRSNNKMIAGVCAGLAEYRGIDITAARLGFTALTLFTGFAGIPFYIVAWIVMPESEAYA